MIILENRKPNMLSSYVITITNVWYNGVSEYFQYNEIKRV